ncbi:MAG: hypothetical protein WBB76_09940 [Gaiellaceae bacterium]
MRRSLRLLLVACAGLVVLALAAPALTKYGPPNGPTMTVEQSSYKPGAKFTADFFVWAPADNDPTYKVTTYSPATFNANLGQAPGTKVGTVVALAHAKALQGAPVALAGNVVVGNPADANLQAAALRCTGSATIQEVLVMNMTVPGTATTIAISDFVSKSGFVVQQVCLASSDVDPSAGGAPLGAQIVSMDYTISGMFSNPGKSDGYQWVADFTPYLAGTGTPNPAGALEWRTYVGLPSSLTFSVVKSTSSSVTFTGKLSVPQLAPNGIRLDLYAGPKPNPAPSATSGGTGKHVARTKSLKRTGRYSITLASVKKRTFFQMRFENYGLAGGCPKTPPSPSGLPLPCNGADFAPLTSRQVAVSPPPKKKRH